MKSVGLEKPLAGEGLTAGGGVEVGGGEGAEGCSLDPGLHQSRWR